MKRDDELKTLADENFVASFLKVVEHSAAGQSLRFGGVFAFVTGLPLGLFNGCVVVEQADPRELDDALRWVGEAHVPHQVFVASELESEIGSSLLAHGFERVREPYPGMVLSPIPEPPEPAAGVVVAAVEATDPDEFVRVNVELGVPPHAAAALFSRDFIADSDVRAFVGRLRGAAVGASLAIRSARSSGVYNVATLPAARRQGVGQALTWAAVEAGRAWGSDAIVLQSSAMARSLYEALGFRTVAPYTTFSRAALDPA